VEAGAGTSTSGPAHVLHLGDDPTDAVLLRAELAADGLDARVSLARTEADLHDALARGDVTVVVADLPLPWATAADSLADVQRRHPDVPVIFRPGSVGLRTVADPMTPVGRALREVLSMAPTRMPSEERRQLIDQLVRNREAQVRLSRLDFWDFDCTIRDITSTAATLLDVKRVGIWEVDPVDRRLVCTMLFDRDDDTHDEQPGLELGPAYLKALEDDVFVAADDAVFDPRTSEFAVGYLDVFGITSMLDAPMHRSGAIVGVVCHEHVGPARHWTIVDQCTAAVVAGLVTRAFEVRDLRQAEDRLREAEKFEVIGRLAGRISHDLNNLLTVIIGNAQLAMLDEHTDQDHEGLVQIVQASDDAAALIRQLLTYSRRSIAPPTIVDVVARLDDVRPLVERVLGRTVRARFELGDGPVWVALDPTQLQQVMLNFAANARDAMPLGGDFVVELSRLREAEVPVVRLTVRDTGDGIAEHVLPRVFEPFFTTKDLKVGTGLGLDSVQEIVRQAGGRVAVASTAGEGTTFEVTLPESAAARTAVEPSPVAPPPRRDGPARATVLVVEADDAVRRTLGLLATRAGCRVVEAADPRDALGVLARGELPDVVVTDQVLPGIDGARLVQAMRTTSPGLPAAIIADAGSYGEAELEVLRRAGATLVLDRPVRPGALGAALDLLVPAR
jgi:two-component system, cell cycle sensor histidine kinase and response regulator CckA